MKKNKIIIIIDYGLGNLNSVVRALVATGAIPRISSDLQELAAAEKLILPGVGAFEEGMKGLKKRNLIKLIKEHVQKGKYLMGLCLGMQLLFQESEEFGLHKGLSLINGKVKKLELKDKSYKIPHVGWNQLIRPKGQNWKDTILKNVKNKEMAYFVHSYAPFPKNKEFILAQTEYGGEIFCSVVAHKNVMGTQFHPEKSADVGQRILKNFLKLP